MATLFTKIIENQIPSHRIMESDDFLAFLDIRPISPGHTLVVPKKEVDYIFDLPDRFLSEIMLFSGKVARKIEAAVDCKRIGMMVAGLEVPHAHVHLVPINSLESLNFAKAKAAQDKDLAEMADKIRKQITE